MRSSTILSCVIACAVPFTLSSSPATAQTTVELDEILLTGGLAPIEAAQIGRAYSRITAEDITRRGITSVQDALRALPGISVGSAGSNFTQIRIRGGEANHTKLLVDGVALSSSTDEYILAALDTAEIAQIEVLRGPQSVYFGSNAASGVINIITKKAEGSGYGGKAEFGNGHAFSSYVQTRGKTGGLRLALSEIKDRGFDFSGKNGEKDFTNRRSYRLSGDWQVNPLLRLSASLSQAREHYAYDNTAWPLQSYDDYLIDGAGAETLRREAQATIAADFGHENGIAAHRLEYAQSRFHSQYIGYDWDKTTSESLKYRATIGLNGSANEASQKILFMAEHLRDENSAAADYTRKTNSVAVEYRGSFANGFHLQAGLRHDQNNRYADFTGWNIAGSYTVNDQLRLHASAGKASVKPSYLERFGNPIWGILPNADLIPEINESIDFGLELSTADGRGTVDITAFFERLRDEIASDGNYPSQSINIAGTGKRRGLELQGRYQLGAQWEVGVNYTYLDSRQGDGRPSIRRPRHELGLSTHWTTADERLRLSGDLRLVSGIKDTNTLTPYPYAQTTLPSFATVNVAAQYQLSDQMALTARVSNLFDKKGQEVLGYRNAERTAWLGISADF